VHPDEFINPCPHDQHESGGYESIIMTAMHIAQLSIFIAGTAALAYLSRGSLRAPGVHGYYRFFAWACILGLFALNVDVWFRNAFSPFQLMSWGLLCVSAYLVIAGVLLLHRFGQADTRRQESPLYDFEKTTHLVTEGLYHYIRHPLYSSLLFLAWGIWMKDPGWLSAILAVAVTGLLIATARADEEECRLYFGPPYAAYMTKTKMFIPYIF
jgi:protein-S-isoprenylcysteine O-methyltransferase Ste14